MPQVQIIQGGKSRTGKLAESLGESLGQGLGSFLTMYGANKSLDKVLNNPQLQNAPMSQRLSALETALRPYGEYGQNILKNRLAIEQQQQSENVQGVLSDVLNGKNVSENQLKQLPSEAQFKIRELQQKQNLGENIKKSLVKAGYPEETAELWKQQFQSAPVGGQSDVIRHVNDLIKRSPKGKGKTDETINGQPIEDFMPEVPEPMGLTPNELVQYHNKLRGENLPHFEETQTQKRFLKNESNALSTLSKITETEKLPQELGRLMIDPETGNLRPYAQVIGGMFGAVNPETQLFIKTVYDFTTKAKDSFGARVTNFDLQTFMNRLPTLLNDDKGRLLIIEQMNLINQLNSLYENALDKVYKHHGLSNIPYEKAVEQAENLIAEDEEKITGKLRSILDRQDEIYSKLKSSKPQEKQTSERPGFVQIRDPEGVLRWVPENIAKQLGP